VCYNSRYKTSEDYQSSATTNSINTHKYSDEEIIVDVVEEKEVNGFKMLNSFSKLNPDLWYANKCFWIDIHGIIGKTKMVTTSATDLYFLNEKGIIQSVNVKTLDEEMNNPNRKRHIHVSDDKESLNKPVDQVYSGMYSHCKTRRLIGDIKCWTTKDVIDFLHQKGFVDFDNVITHDKIDGKK